jgi:predicted  nucleic acid-binding Zn-ribbon protein
MPIKWSAVKVSKAMDDVESQVILAEQFLDEAKSKAEEALKIEDLPEYMSQRIRSLTHDLERIKKAKESIESVRKNIPEGTIEAERNTGRHGKTESML